MLIHVIFHLPYRQLEGFLRKLSELIPEIKPTDYTNIWRRGIKLRLNLPDTILASDEPVVISADSTGIKVTNRGEWMREKMEDSSRLDQGPSGSECGYKRDSYNRSHG
jgi:hypothetical protein